MIRVYDLHRALDFFIQKLGLIETRRHNVEAGRFTLVFLATAHGEPEIELTHNWDETAPYSAGRNFGHFPATPSIERSVRIQIDLSPS